MGLDDLEYFRYNEIEAESLAMYHSKKLLLLLLSIRLDGKRDEDSRMLLGYVFWGKNLQ